MELSSLLAISYYEVVAPIDGAHNVYLVRHMNTGRFFVKKTLDIYSADVYRDLKEHPVEGIPRIIEFGEDEGRLIIIEEYIPGETLLDKIERSSAAAKSAGKDRTESGDILTVEQIGRYIVSLCEILDRLHRHDPPMVHRDLKPSNIILTTYDKVVLIDFNAAKFYSGDTGRKSDTVLMGTRGYAAPEQYGFRESSPQTDIFSVGRILQECVAALPAEDHTFDKVIDRCLEMDPSRRYPSAGALRSAVMRCLGQSDRPDITGPTVNPYLPPGFRTLNPWKMLIASVVYFLVFDLCLTLDVPNMDQSVQPYVRIWTLLTALTDIAVGTNYLGVQKLFPYLKRNGNASKRHPALYAAGVILTMAAITLILFVVMVYALKAIFGPELTGF